MVADGEAAMAAIIATIFYLSKEEEESMETVMDLPDVLVVLFTKERRHIPRITGYVVRHLGFSFATCCSFSPWEQNGRNGVLSIPE